MFASKSNKAIATGLVIAVFLWGSSNTGVKFLVQYWPPDWVGGSRFVCAGLLLLGVLRWTKWLGTATPLSAELRSELWRRGGLSLAVYIAVFNWSLRFASVSHVAVYVAAAPVWALLLEGPAGRDKRELAKRYAASALALTGVVVLFWPALRATTASVNVAGEILGLTSSFLWTNYGRQCRVLGATLSGVEITAHTMWRGGLLLLAAGLIEVAARGGVPWRLDLVLVQGYCIVAGGVIAFALWTNALRHWKTSEVYLFNNLVPLSVALWARALLSEPITPTFWLAMVLVVSGVLVGQTNWQRLFGRRWPPLE